MKRGSMCQPPCPQGLVFSIRSQMTPNGPRNEALCIEVAGSWLPRLSPLNNPMESNRRVEIKEENRNGVNSKSNEVEKT